MKVVSLEKISSYCSKLIYAMIILLPFMASFSSAAVNTAIVISVFAFIFKKLSAKEPILAKTPINKPFLLLAAISLLSFFNTVDLRSSIEGIIKLLKYGFLFIIVAEELKDKKRLKWAIIGIICGLYLAALDGFYSLYFGRDFLRNKPPDFVIGLMRMKAAFPHTNILAGYLALFLPVPIAMTLYYLRKKKKALLGLISALALYALILTFSRSAVLGVWLAILFIGIIKKDKLILMLLLLSLVIAPFFAPKNIRNWAKATNSPWEFLLNKERFDLYKTALNMVKAHPFIGVGVNTYCLNYQKYKVSEASVLTDKGNWYAHNIFLQMAAEIGIVGLAVFIWMLLALFRSFFIFLKKTDDHFLEICALGIVSGLLAFLVNGLTETNLYYPKIAVLFWYQVGLFFGSIKLGGLSWVKSK